MDAEVLRDVRDGPAGGADLADRALTKLGTGATVTVRVSTTVAD